MKKIVVIGATGTLGQAVCIALRERHEVIEVGATRGRYQVDSTDPDALGKLFAQLGKVDGVVTTTGKVHFGPLAQTTPAQFWVGLRDKLMGQVNVVLAAVAILGAYLFPMYLVGHWHTQAMLSLGTAVVATMALYFTWYRNLPAEL